MCTSGPDDVGRVGEDHVAAAAAVLGVVALAAADQIAARLAAEAVPAHATSAINPVKSAAAPFLHFLIGSSMGRESLITATKPAWKVPHKGPRGGGPPTLGVGR
jgi:hypothetical protein